MEGFEKLVNREIRELQADEPAKQARALKLSRKIFRWLHEGGVDRIEEGLKQEVVAIEQAFAARERELAQEIEER